MALADPQTLNYNAVNQSAPLTATGSMNRTYSVADGSLALDISHAQSKAGRWRRMVRVRHTKVAADPFTSGKNLSYQASVYTVIDVPSLGYTNAEIDLVVDCLLKWMSGAGSTASLDRVVAGEC